MAKKINIGSVAGIDAAIKFLETEMSKEALQAKADKIASALIDKAEEVASDVYPPEVELIKKGGSLTAKHPEIAFIEFGTGYGVDKDNEFARSPDAPEVDVGSWSRKHGGEFWKTHSANPGSGRWHYKGQRFTQTPAIPGMEFARLVITNEKVIEETVKEVFHLD